MTPTTTLTLAAFIEARLVDRATEVDTIPDWYCTESARGEGWGSRGDCPLCGKYMFDGTESVTKEAYWEHMEDAHQRLQVLREVAAMRAVVELHAEAVRAADEETDTEEGWVKDGVVRALHETLRALAQAWVSHDDFQEAWRA